MQNLIQDVRYGLRTIRKSPGFAAAAIVVLALGIGANTAIFSVVNAVLLQPLPFSHPEQLVQIWHTPPQKSFPGIKLFAVSAANYLDWQADNHVFQNVSLYSGASYNLSGNGEPQFVRARKVTADFFRVLGVEPLLGRTFSADDDHPGHERVAVLSEPFWRSQFGGDRDIVGRTITLNDAAYTVIGVMRSKYQFPLTSDPVEAVKLWTPLALTDKESTVRGEHHFGVIGRLRPDVSVQQAQAEMDTISQRLEQQYPEDDRGWGAKVKPLREELVGDVRTPLLVLLGAVALVLLIACANAANLVLARTVSRQKEIAVRSALGASRLRLIGQVISETAVLSLAGGFLGLLIAHFGVKLIVAFFASKLPRAADIGLDGSVLGFTLIVSLLTGILAGLLPALRLSRVNVNDALKQGTRTSSDASGNRTRGVLVVSEVALSLMLLIGAGLLIRSLWILRQVDPGFDPHNVLAVAPSVTGKTFPEPLQQIAFFNQVLDRVRSLPGVEAAATIDSLPLNGGGSNQPVQLEGHPVQAMADQPEVSVRLISTGYLRTMHIPVIRGRDFGEQETPQSPGAVLVSESMAKRLWPGEDPIGKHVTMYFQPDKVREVVGIVGDVKDDGLDDAHPRAMLYEPLSHLGTPRLGGWGSFPLWIVVRTHSNPANLTSAVTSAIHQVNSAVPVRYSANMEDFVSSSLSQQRFNMLLLAAFAGLALLLAAVGIYSVLAYSVKRRVREIGIRMALGAQTDDVLRLVVLEGMRPTGMGILIGIAGALALGRVISGLIYGVKPTDVATFAAVTLVLIGVSLVASVVPAYRATRVEPVKTLREE